MIEEKYWDNPFGKSFHYVTYLPKDYDPSVKYPMVFFMHGAGERGPEDGSKIDELYKYGWLERAKKYGEDFPCIIVAPQCPYDKIWTCYFESLNRFLDFLLENYAVDPKRVYLTGLSMGGTGSWHWSLINPERFAAVAPICGTGIYWDAWALINKPVWAFHGDIDSLVPPEESLQMVKSINSKGGHAKLTIYNNVDHSSWIYAYEGHELLDWMLAQSL